MLHRRRQSAVFLNIFMVVAIKNLIDTASFNEQADVTVSSIFARIMQNTV